MKTNIMKKTKDVDKQKNELFIVYSLNKSSEDRNNIYKGKPTYFSTREKAEELISRFSDYYSFLYEDLKTSDHVYCILMEEFGLDSPHRYQLSTRVYSPEGLLISESIVPDDGPFYGRPENSIQHKIGEVVELPFGDHLAYGIVVRQPLCLKEDFKIEGLMASDDSYEILQHRCHEIDYVFAPMVFKPTKDVPDIIRKDLEYAFEKAWMDKVQI